MDVVSLTRQLVDIESITGNEGPVGDFLNGARFAHQELDDGSSVGIAERVKRVILTIVLTAMT